METGDREKEKEKKKKGKRSIFPASLANSPTGSTQRCPRPFVSSVQSENSRYINVYAHTHTHTYADKHKLEEITIYANSFHNLGRANRTLRHSPRLMGEISTQFFLVSKLLTRFCWLPRPFATSLLGGFIDVGDLSEKIHTKIIEFFFPLPVT